MRSKISAATVPPLVNGSLSGLTFVAPHPQNDYSGSGLRNLILDIPAGWLNLEPIRAPAHSHVRAGISLSNQEHPKSLIGVRLGSRDLDRKIKTLGSLGNPCGYSIEMSYDERRLHHGIVRHNVDWPLTAGWGNIEKCLKDRVGDERTVLPAGKANDPWIVLLLGEVFSLNVLDDRPPSLLNRDIVIERERHIRHIQISFEDRRMSGSSV